MSRTGVHIENDLYLDISDSQMTLKKYTGNFDKNNEETSISLGYYTNLEGVARKLYQLKLSKTTVTNMQELVKDHKQIMNEIRETFQLKGLI